MIGFSGALGVTSAFAVPSQQALIAALVEEEDVPQAVALNSMTFNLARAVGPGRVPNELMARYYAQRASAGLIVTEATGISREGLGWPNVRLRSDMLDHARIGIDVPRNRHSIDIKNYCQECGNEQIYPLGAPLIVAAQAIH